MVCSLGVLFDSKFSFTSYVNSVIKSCFVNLPNLHHILCHLSYDVSVMVADNLVSSSFNSVSLPRISQDSRAQFHKGLLNMKDSMLFKLDLNRPLVANTKVFH